MLVGLAHTPIPLAPWPFGALFRSEYTGVHYIEVF